jgi:hypothetical protein
MGVDLNWAGSLSYPRFYEELEAVATQVFGATVSKEYIEAKNKPENNTITGYFFANAHTSCDKFVWPDGTPEVLKTFFRAPTEYYDPEFVKDLWALVEPHAEKVEALSDQFYEELKCDAMYGESWCVC